MISKVLSDLFSENGSVSMMRVMSLTCCLAAVTIAIVGLGKPIVDYSGLTILVSAFLSAAFGGKVLQKRIEVSGAKSDVDIDMDSPEKKHE